MQNADPFTTLGLAPTLDAGAVKQAYFAAVKRNPPHVDAAAFRRVRSAYESLSDRARLMAAYCRAPIDAEAGLAHWTARWQARVDMACQARSEEERLAHGVEYVIDRCSRVRLP
jgi:hypothetical protein